MTDRQFSIFLTGWFSATLTMFACEKLEKLWGNWGLVLSIPLSIIAYYISKEIADRIAIRNKP